MLLFAVFTLGYLAGVWMACTVLRVRQGDYEEGKSSSFPTTARASIGGE